MGAFLLASSCKKNSPTPNPVNVTPSPVAKDVPAGAGDGVTFLNNGTSAIFNLYAPGKKSVTVLGDFNSWTAGSKYTMYNSTDGTRWWVQVDGLDPSAEYAYEYLINGNLKVADPYTHKVLDSANDPYIPATVYPNLKAYPAGKGNGIVSTMQYSAPAYSWKTTSFTPAAPKNMVVYELLVRDFVATHSYKTLTDTLSYLVNLGVNAVELMPVNEFEGNVSWGYNSNYMFALDKYYGQPNDYKAFIDACHAKGIAVIQDIVLEDQFGSSPMVQMYATAAGSPAANSPWFDQTNMHPDAVGYQLNHSTAATQYFSENVMKYWLQEYHIDGYRFDQAKGYTQVASSDETTWANYDATRVALWTKYNTYIKSVNTNAYVILENFSANTEESAEADLGMISWTNLSTSAEQATMGYPTGPTWDISGLFYDGYGFKNPYGLMAYFESHDEERLQFKNEQYGNSTSGYNVKDIPTGLERDEAGAVFMFSSPGPKMLWEFGEQGYDISINSGTDRTSPKPPHWEYMSDPNRHHLYQVYSRMIRMKKSNPVFASTNFTYSLTGAVKTIQMLDATADIEVIGNFDVVPQTATITFPSVGTWYDNFSGTSISLTSTSYTVTLQPGEYHLYSNTPLTLN